MRYLLVEERSLIGLASDIKQMTKVKTLDGIKEMLIEAEDHVQELIKHSDSINEEEKTVLERRRPNRKDT